MKLWITSATILLLTVSCASSAPKDASRSPASMTASATSPVPAFLTGIHQFTFAGARAGEGYFSQDGRYLTFQSERVPGNPFYQIYVMDLKTGAEHRVSPGIGKTSCSWISPDDKHVLFASTQADPKSKEKAAEEYENRKHPKTKYSWNFDDQFDIYQADFKGGHFKNLTHSPGYDAEGSYSPDGKWIAFASNRTGYTEKLSAEDRALFEKDPSSQMEIYIMRADGSQVRRLTHSLGYDGGPFFSPDGKRLTYRHFTVDGSQAEVHTMNLDGTDDKELTHMKAMSWAPFYHPSGDYLIFTTNKQGYANFELYIVDVNGTHEPVRVTDLPGFDGLPVFAPDGKSLLWAHTNERGEAQLFQADWNDDLARKVLDLTPRVPRVNQMQLSVNPQDAKTWVEYLASEHMQGRATGSAQENEYLSTIAQAFKDLGLKPVGGKDYLQGYEFTSGIEYDQQGKNALVLQVNGVTLPSTLGKDWAPLSYSKTGTFASAPIVFAGYGIEAPAAGNQATYDSYNGLDVKGKWVVAFSGLPEDIANDRRFFLHAYSRLQHKAMTARRHGAVGLIIVEDSETPSPQMNLVFEGRSEDAGLPVVRLSPALAEQIFKATGSDRKGWTAKLSKGDIAGSVLDKTNLQADVALRFKKSSAHNAVAMLQVPGAKSTIAIGAHGDHLGHGEMGNSLYRGEPKVHYGADDNASGVAAVLEIAKDLAHKVKDKSVSLKANIVFAVWTGEEIGVLGSTHFANNPKSPKLSAYLNMDMVGRYRDQLLVQGVASAPQWKTLVEENTLKHPMVVHTQDDPYLPSDALTFYMKQVPVIYTFTGSHAEYHSPKDRPENQLSRPRPDGVVDGGNSHDSR